MIKIKSAFLFRLGSCYLFLSLSACNIELENANASHSYNKENESESISQEAIKYSPKLLEDNKAAIRLFESFDIDTLATQFVISTGFGDITIELFKETPLHLSNFNYLTELKYFDDTYFYRVSPEHVIQAGNSDDYNILTKRKKIGSYKIPYEESSHYHQSGNIAMARSYKKNELKRSEPFEFYIVIGKKYNIAQLELMEQKYEIKLNDTQKSIYQEIGGSPHLDGEHTVIGRVIKGMDVAYAISKVRADSGEWPLDNIKIKIQAIK